MYTTYVLYHLYVSMVFASVVFGTTAVTMDKLPLNHQCLSVSDRPTVLQDCWNTITLRTSAYDVNSPPSSVVSSTPPRFLRSYFVDGRVACILCTDIIDAIIITGVLA